MSVIASRENPRYKQLRRLIERSPARKATGLAFLEGVHLCETYRQRLGPPRLCVVAESGPSHAEVAVLLAALEGVERLVVTDTLYRSLSQLDHAPGIGFVIDIPPARPAVPLDVPAVLIDRLQDPGNLGSILRSAAAAGVGLVCSARGSVAAWSPKVLRAAMGAHFFLELREDCDLSDLVATSRLPVFATSSHGAASLYDQKLDRDVVWVFGNEGAGVDPDLLKHAQTLRIPQPGGMESLNVAAAAAICLFEALRQRR